MAPERHSLVLVANCITHGDSRALAVVHLLRRRDGEPHGGAHLLLVEDGTERELDVYVGETFRVGAQTWRLDEVQMPEDRRFSATLSRAGCTAAAEQAVVPTEVANHLDRVD